MKTGRYAAALLLAVTMLMAAAGAQDSGPPPSGQQDPTPSGQQDPNAAQSGGSSQDANVPQDQGLPADDTATPQQDANRPQLQTREGSQPRTSVARVSLIHGNVSMQRGDSSDWSSATINTPLVPGDQIATADRSRAEVQLDFANVMRLAASSQVKIADLSRSRIQVQVSLGYANYSVYKGNEADIEIDTPNVAVHPTRPGRYRVQVNSDNETDVIVRDGEAEVTTPEGSTTVKEGQVIAVRGTDNPEYKVENAPPGDDWDRWNLDRDRSIESASSWQNTNRYYTGSSDLDANGRWINVPGYGQVWQPYQEGPNWAPYQDGRWVWEPGWGWTWVSYESWGWAPYHYGRWFYWNTGWVWWPGPVYPYYRPLWAPAYVSFFGFGGHVGFGFGFGSVGWLPCGPFDPFFPWWGFGFGHVNVVVFNNFRFGGFHGPFIRPLGIAGRHPFISNTRLALTNARVRGGITSVSGADFARGGIGSRRFGVEEGALRGSHMMTANVPVVPTHDSLHAGAGTRAGMGGVQARNGGHFVTRNAAPAGPPSFHEQASQMERVVQNSGRNMGEASNGRFANNEAAGTGRGQNGGPVSRQGTMETGHNQGPSNATTQGNEGSRNGWRTFSRNNDAPNSSHGSFGNTASPGNVGRSDRPGWAGSPGGNSGKPELQMSKPIVTPRAQAPSPTYSRPATTYSRPSSPSPQSYGNYSPRGYSSSPYGGRTSSPSYSGGRNNGSYNGSRSNGGGSHSGGGGHSSSGGGHSGGGGGHSGGHH